MKDVYIRYKYDYNDYILFIKSGNFYICLNKDAFVLKNVFDYKIIEQKNFVKAGFPISSLSKVTSKLDILNINYAVIDKYIVLKNKFVDNKYNLYVQGDVFEKRLDRINNIQRLLKRNLHCDNFDEIMNEVERIICKINF